MRRAVVSGTPLPILTTDAAPRRRLPPWLKRPMPTSEMLETRKLLDGLRLNTVCVEARCPNLTECWSRGTATFMILGDHCTRRCGFCAVGTARPQPVELDEPQRLADAAAKLGLRHVVITSVARDDLRDEGAQHFADCIAAVRSRLPQATVEVLVPDFHGKAELIAVVTGAAPEVYNHNIETVARLQKKARPAARYERSLGVLRTAKAQNPRIATKSGLMVGLGETHDEIVQTLRDLRAHDCDLLTIGQYLRPGDRYLPVERYYTPEEFETLGRIAEEMGFSAVASGPFVRSSYFAETLFAETDILRGG
ncbi:MAG: lipoyl synthase [Phycisphaerales bacterium]|nr:lipoyl synthase [Phycisphaerales bacterium]